MPHKEREKVVLNEGSQTQKVMFGMSPFPEKSRIGKPIGMGSGLVGCTGRRAEGGGGEEWLLMGMAFPLAVMKIFKNKTLLGAARLCEYTSRDAACTL